PGDARGAPRIGGAGRRVGKGARPGVRGQFAHVRAGGRRGQGGSRPHTRHEAETSHVPMLTDTPLPHQGQKMTPKTMRRSRKSACYGEQAGPPAAPSGRGGGGRASGAWRDAGEGRVCVYTP